MLVLAGAFGADARLVVFMQYLRATSPGGMDTVAIIAASSPADLSFVMALQVVRLVIVLISGPPLARFIAQRVG